MKRSKLLYLCIPLLMVLLLSGCHAEFGVTVTGIHAPKNTELAFLVPDAEFTEDDLRTEESCDKPRCYYHADGWIAAGMLRYYRESDTGDSENSVKLVQGSGSKDDAIALCERFGTVRIAAVDEKGRVVQISGDIPLHEEGKLYAVRDFTYDFASGALEITDYYRLQWNGNTPEEWWMFSAIAAQLGALTALIAILINALLNKRENAGVIEWIIVICSAAPFVFMTVLYLVIHYHPALTPNPKPLDSSDIFVLAVSNGLFFLTLLGVGTHRAVLRSREAKKQYYDADE